jgi:hypothetical protein
MSRSISISIFKKKCHISYDFKGTIIVKDCYQLISIKDMKNHIGNFLKENSIKKEKIDNIIISTDLTRMDEYYKSKKRDVVYIQISPYHKDEWKYSKIFKEFDVKIHPYNIGLPKEKNYFKNTDEIRKKISNIPFDTILINSIFSGMYKKREEELVENFKKIFSEYKLIFSSVYESNNYVLRENALILDYYFKQFSIQFYDDLKEVLRELKINSKCYGLRSDGYLSTLEDLIEHPSKTRDSYYTNKILSYSKYIDKETFSIISKNDFNSKKISIKKKKIEKDREYSELDFLKIPPYLIKTSKYKNTTEMFKNEDIKKEELILNLTNERITKKINVINLEYSGNILNLGISNAKFLIELNATVFDSSEDKIEEELKIMKNKADEIIKNTNIALSNLEYNYKRSNLKYILHNSYYIQLRLTGDI